MSLKYSMPTVFDKASIQSRSYTYTCYYFSLLGSEQTLPLPEMFSVSSKDNPEFTV